ncbi:MAG: GFA family protein [Deltaproteobacteria bacterium]|nr:MAG: GFA family protein [Deltaproteobacteria bacterium]TMA83543.1 MAG: GFA family protein [Deltaproteobacteria bacterium]TMB20230.1 MAG: GFA family protein [Deltaproteobacteria bacterium]
MCRKSHGAAFSTFARLTAGDFRVVGGREHVRAYRSSPPIERTFCDTCGARLTVRFEGMPHAVWVTARAYALTRYRSVPTPRQRRAGETPASTPRRPPLGSLCPPHTSV